MTALQPVFSPVTTLTPGTQIRSLNLIAGEMKRPLVERTAAHTPSLYSKDSRHPTGMVTVREVQEWETEVRNRIQRLKDYMRSVEEEEPKTLEREKKGVNTPVPKNAFKDKKARIAIHIEAREFQLVRIRQELRIIQAVDSSYTLENKPTLESSLVHTKLAIGDTLPFTGITADTYTEKNIIADYIYFLARDGTSESNKKLEDIKRLFITPVKIPLLSTVEEGTRMIEIDNPYFVDNGSVQFDEPFPSVFMPLFNKRYYYGAEARPKIFEGLVKAGKAQQDAWHASGNAALAQQQRQALATKTPAEQAQANAEVAAAAKRQANAEAKRQANAVIEAQRRANAEASEVAAEAVRKTTGVREAGLSITKLNHRFTTVTSYKELFDTEIVTFRTNLGGHITGVESNYTDFIDNEEHQKTMLSTIARIRNYRRLMQGELDLAVAERNALESNKYATGEQKTEADEKISTIRVKLELVIEDLSRPDFNGKTLEQIQINIGTSIAEKLARKAAEEFKREVLAEQARAQAEGDKLIADAKAVAAKAQVEADKLIADAKAEAAKAQADADKLKGAATAEAADARAEAEQIKGAAMAEAADAKAEAEKIKEAIAKALEDAQAKAGELQKRAADELEKANDRASEIKRAAAQEQVAAKVIADDIKAIIIDAVSKCNGDRDCVNKIQAETIVEKYIPHVVPGPTVRPSYTVAPKPSVKPSVGGSYKQYTRKRRVTKHPGTK